MKEPRPPKPDDQKNIEYAFNLLKNYMAEYPEIEPTLWAAAFWSILVDGYNASGTSYEEFTEEWDRLKHHYKHWFDE
jgi:hypothetical protein